MLWRLDEHEPLTDARWDAGRARDSIAEIVTDAEGAEAGGAWPGHPLDDVREDEHFWSLYLGSAGMIWALWELSSSLDCAAATATALERYRARPDFESDAHPPSLLMGETGLLVVAHKTDSPAANRDRLRELIHDNREHPTREMMWGSPGTILAARACGLEDEARDSADLLYAQWDRSADTWTNDLYGTVQVYLGPPHGTTGNIHALRGFVDEAEVRARTTRLLTRTATREGTLVNWPPVDRPMSELASQVRVQWCHGAPGVISTVGDLIPIDLAIAGGELTWCAGPLRKGAGLCHGTAGNGFALLRLHQLTGDPLWLERARRFAMHATEQVSEARETFGRGRYTLWTGDVGVALYLRACLDARASFPTIDAF
jgi:lanthionine synthetase-like protein